MDNKKLDKLIEERIKANEEKSMDAWINVADFFGRIITSFSIILFGKVLLSQVASIQSDYIFIITLTCALATCYGAIAMAYSAVNKLNFGNKK